MPDEDIQDISIFLEQIKLKTKLPPADEIALELGRCRGVGEVRKIGSDPVSFQPLLLHYTNKTPVLFIARLV